MQRVLSFIHAKKIFIIPLVAITVFLTVRTILLQKPSPDIIYMVKRENLVDTVQVSGTYTTASQTVVTSPATGIISQLYVKNGDYVKKGEPLFYVESTATTDQINAAYADYTAALSALQSAQNNVQSLDATMWTQQQAYLAAQNAYNNKELHPVNPATQQIYTDLEKTAINNAVTQTQKAFQASEQAFQTANVAVNAGQAKVTQTKRSYDETKSATVFAQADGKVVNLEEKVGDAVSAPTTAVTIAGTTTGQAAISTATPQPVLIIANLSDPYIGVNISEDYATRVMEGQLTSIVFDAMRNETFPGRVSDIATVGTSMQGVVTYAARIQTSELPALIKPNMTAIVTIETLRKNNVIDVPNSAIVSQDDSAYVVAAKSHKHIMISLGEKGVAKTEVTEGLNEGTEIVANPD